MKLKLRTWGVVAGVCWAALAVSARQVAPPEGYGMLAPEVWLHEGDADGDGLTDAFESANGLDPGKADSFGDGTSDEERLSSSGKTMWELQAAPPAEAGGGSGGAGCGATGMEVALLLALLSVLRNQEGSRRHRER